MSRARPPGVVRPVPLTRFREERIEPPTPAQVERLIAVAEPDPHQVEAPGPLRMERVGDRPPDGLFEGLIEEVAETLRARDADVLLRLRRGGRAGAIDATGSAVLVRKPS
ncbi:hypothetical protein GCM10010182_62910 [Actinomadura cremea]|nr:hypothetical protein GCM10010182_62910 [Actinomadura cremea]